MNLIIKNEIKEFLNIDTIKSKTAEFIPNKVTLIGTVEETPQINYINQDNFTVGFSILVDSPSFEPYLSLYVEIHEYTNVQNGVILKKGSHVYITGELDNPSNADKQSICILAEKVYVVGQSGDK